MRINIYIMDYWRNRLSNTGNRLGSKKAHEQLDWLLGSGFSEKHPHLVEVYSDVLEARAQKDIDLDSKDQ